MWPYIDLFFTRQGMANGRLFVCSPRDFSRFTWRCPDGNNIECRFLGIFTLHEDKTAICVKTFTGLILAYVSGLVLSKHMH